LRSTTKGRSSPTESTGFSHPELLNPGDQSAPPDGVFREMPVPEPTAFAAFGFLMPF
jgi:hypothetical protein